MLDQNTTYNLDDSGPIVKERFDVDDDRWEAFKKACD